MCGFNVVRIGPSSVYDNASFWTLDRRGPLWLLLLLMTVMLARQIMRFLLTIRELLVAASHAPRLHLELV